MVEAAGRESRTAGPVFVVDAVLGDGARVLGMWAGATRAVEESSWALAKRRTEVELDIEPVDVVLFGLPRDFHYGPGMGTNPILVAQAMLSMAEIALQRTSRVIVVGAGKPGYARAMGLLPARTVAEALAEAERLTGPNPSIMVLPEFLTHIPPHLYAARA